METLNLTHYLMMLSNIEIMWHDNIIVNECEAVDF
jgi:hypothetical protein